MSGPGNNRKAVAAAITANFIFGLSFMATSIALEYTTPEILLAVRFTASILVMLLLMVLGIGKLDLRGKPLGKFILLGLCEPVIYFFGETYGIKYTTSSFSGVMIALIPVSAALLSMVLLHEKLPLKKAAWIVCSVTGVVIISVSQRSEGVIQIIGILCLLVAIISASFHSILSRSLADRFTAFERTFVMMLMGWVAFTLTAFLRGPADFIPMVASAVTNMHVMLPVVYLSVISSVLAFFCVNYSFTHLDVSKATIFGNICPIVSVAAGVLVLGEPFSLVYLLAIVLILLCVYKVNSFE